MGLITIGSDTVRCSVVPELGAGIADFSVLGPSKFFYPLMRRAMPGETNASSLGSFFMAPWVNRIGGAAFEFGGERVALRPNSANPGAPAQHGDVRARAWKVEKQGADAVELSFDSAGHEKVNWAWRFGCRARYAVTGAGLRVELDVENRDTRAFPAGCGHHPYFSRRMWDDRDVVEVGAAVTGRYPLKDGVPTGRAERERLTERLGTLQPVADEHIDAVFGGFDAKKGAVIRYPASGVTLTITGCAEMKHLVLYCPHADGGASGKGGSPLSFIAAEPQTQVNGALNWPQWGDAVTGTVVLRPGEVLRTWVEFGVKVG